MQDKVWRCKDGRTLLVSQMDTRHINNCIRLIEYSIAIGKRWRVGYLERLRLELFIRTLKQ
jgi:hypothetical protein